MIIKPILPLWIMAASFGILFLISAIVIIRNKFNILDKFLTLLRLLIIYGLAFTIGIRPMVQDIEYEYNASNLDVLFVLDNTISMWALDYDGDHPRMEGALKDINYILNEFEGSNFGIVTFDNTSRVLSPFSQDTKYLSDLLDSVKAPESYYARGSDLSMPYANVEALLQSSSKKEDRKAIVFFITDGEITNGESLTDYSALSGLIHSGAVLGYGSEAGGKMKLEDGESSYIFDYETNEDALSKIDEANLQKVASDLGIAYYNMYGQHSAFEETVQVIKESAKTVIESGEGIDTNKDLYYLFAIPLAAMLILEIIILFRRGRL